MISHAHKRDGRVAHADLGLVIDADTARTRWRGEPMNYGLAAEALWRGKHAHCAAFPLSDAADESSHRPD